MRTWKILINPKKNKRNAAFCRYFQANTADAKCMYNTANFYIRNTMTGLRKSPEERTHSEIEALHYVFTGIQKANTELWNVHLRQIQKLHVNNGISNMKRATEAYFLSREAFHYPTTEKWFLSYTTLDAIFKFTSNPVYKRMNSQVNQNAIRKATQAWMGYFKALKGYAEEPWKYQAKPKIPGYQKSSEYIAWFTSQVAKLKEQDGVYYLQFVNCKDLLPIGKKSVYAGLKYVKTEVRPEYGRYSVLLTFDDKVKTIPVPKNPKRILGLDPGVGNFLGVANNFGQMPFVIKGGALKSANQRFNKKRAALMSSLTKGKDSSHSTKYSEQLNILSRKRSSFFRDYFYKCAWYLCRYAVASGVQVFVMGHNQNQKQEISLGDVVNQHFVSIPYTQFISILTAIAAKCNIAVVVREESYTSQASLLDMDDIPTYKTGENQNYIFSGKRIHRGLYRSKNGTVMNADINGAANIIRKEYPEAFASMKSLSYLYATTLVIGYKDLYRNAKALSSRENRFHMAGTGSQVCHRYRKENRTAYCILWGKGQFVWKEKKRQTAESSLAEKQSV